MYVRDFFFAGSGCCTGALFESLEEAAVVCEAWLELPPLAPELELGFDEKVDLKKDMLLLCREQEHIGGAVLDVHAQM